MDTYIKCLGYLNVSVRGLWFPDALPRQSRIVSYWELEVYEILALLWLGCCEVAGIDRNGGAL